MSSKLSRSSKSKIWPYFLIMGVCLIYFVYILIDSRYFFYDDFTALKFVAERSYLQVVIDSLASRNVDRHKFIGYLAHKLIYDVVGLKIEWFFLFLFVVHTINCWLVYWVLKRTTGQKYVSFLLATIFAYRFYLWWFSNVHVYLASMFGLFFIAAWLIYSEKPKKSLLLAMWLLWPLMVFSYGPTVLLPLALILVRKNFRPLIPFVILLFLYLPIFVFTPDSMERFASTTNPYKSDFSISSFLISQSIFLHELSGKMLPQSVWLTLAVWLGLGLLALLTRPNNLLWLLAFFAALLANSFFVIHTMFYYLYLPIVFLLVFFGQLFKERYWLLSFIVFLIISAPWSGVYQLAFRFRHPAENFEKKAMGIISKEIDLAIDRGDLTVKLSNWEVTPNLEHAIVYQVIPYFLTSQRRFNFNYSYSRETETLTLKEVFF